MKRESLELLHRLAGLAPDPGTEADLLRDMAAITQFCRELPEAGTPAPAGRFEDAAEAPGEPVERPLAEDVVWANAPRLQGGLFIAPTPKPGSAS